jgi:hypothetical protein
MYIPKHVSLLESISITTSKKFPNTFRMASLAAKQTFSTAATNFKKNVGVTDFGVDSKDPFKTPLIRIASFRGTAAPLFLIPLYSLPAIIAALVACILVAVNMGTNGAFNMSSNPPWNYAQAYALFVFSLPTLVISGVMLFALFAGRLIFSSKWGQIGFFIILTMLSIISGASLLTGFAVNVRELSVCKSSNTTAWCINNRTALIEVLIISIIMMLVVISNWILALLLTFVRPLQYMMIGMNSKWRARMAAAREGKPYEGKTQTAGEVFLEYNNEADGRTGFKSLWNVSSRVGSKQTWGEDGVLLR